MRFEEAVQLRHVLGRHAGALFVQRRERFGHVAVGQRVPVAEEVAADDGVDVVAAAPEDPFAAEVAGWVDGLEGLAVAVCAGLG